MQSFATEPERQIPVVREVDVCVVGGSQSGVAAAVCAARNGATVLLIERNPFLGGQSVGTMVTQWKKLAFINNLGAVCARGIARELLDAVLAKGGSDQLFFDPPGCPEMRDGEEWLDVEAIKLTLLEFCEDAGVELLLDTMVADSIVDRTGSAPQVTGVLIENKSGRQAVLAKAVVDASADLDVVYRAIGEEGVITNPVADRLLPAWYIYAGGVDNDTFLRFAIESDEIGTDPSWLPKYARVDDGEGGHTWVRNTHDPKRKARSFSYPSKEHPDKLWQHLKTNRLIMLAGFRGIIQEAASRGLMKPFEEAREFMNTPSAIYTKWVGHDLWSVATYMHSYDATDAEVISHRECLRVKIDAGTIKILRLIPGWESAYIARSSYHTGLRETRLLKAVTMLYGDDIIEPPEFDRPDVVGRSGGHDPGRNYARRAYPIPYGALVPEVLNGVVCTSRAVGAADHVARDANRGIVPTIVMGQAAGTAAALAVKHGTQIRLVDLEELQDTLRQADVVLDVETVELDTIPDDLAWETQKL